MKLKVKTLVGISFEIEAEPEASVAEVKLILEGTLGQNEYPADRLALIYRGKFLEDGSTLEHNKVDENSFLVLAVSMPDASSNEASCAEETAAPVALVQCAAMANLIGSVARPRSQEHVAMSKLQAAPNLVSDRNLERAIKQILDMRGGIWERSSIIRALHAANNDIERAADYMYLGIPGTVESLLSSGQRSTGPNTNPINLFLQDVPSGAADPEAAGVGVLESLLEKQPQYHQLLDMCIARPQLIQPVFEAMRDECPEVLQLLVENKEELCDILLRESTPGGRQELP